MNCWIWGYHRGDYENYGLLGCNTAKFRERQKQAYCVGHHGWTVSHKTDQQFSLLSDFVGILHGLIFDTEDGGDIFLTNVGLSELNSLITHKTVLLTSKKDDYKIITLQTNVFCHFYTKFWIKGIKKKDNLEW
jgi:hypothetical protein